MRAEQKARTLTTRSMIARRWPSWRRRPSVRAGRKTRQPTTGPVENRCCDALQQLMSRLYRQAGIKGGSSHSGRRTLAAKVLAKTGQSEVVQRIMCGHSWM